MKESIIIYHNIRTNHIEDNPDKEEGGENSMRGNMGNKIDNRRGYIR